MDNYYTREPIIGIIFAVVAMIVVFSFVHFVLGIEAFPK